MPGLIKKEPPEVVRQNHKKVVCSCESCPCKGLQSKRCSQSKNGVPANGIVFQLPKYREPRSDTYSHSVYKKDMCSRYLMKQHAALAQKKASQRPKQPPVLEQERFSYKTIAETDYRRYTSREAAACKAKFPRIKREEGFFFKPGEFTSNVKFPSQSISHNDYSPRVPIQSTYKRDIRDVAYPPFESYTCYDMDYRAPSLDAYPKNRKARKRVLFD